jgi:hypothetical protein
MFEINESQALLHAIYPKYPDLRGMVAAPQDLTEWLENYRAERASSEAIESSRTS